MSGRVIYTAGVFDLLHRGHLNLLRASKALGDILVVGVVSDAGAEAYKRRPVQDEQTRLEVIRELRMVDLAALQLTTDPSPILEWLSLSSSGLPKIMTHGSDWTRLREGQETLDRWRIEFVTLPYTPGISTSDLIAELVERGMAATR